MKTLPIITKTTTEAVVTTPTATHKDIKCQYFLDGAEIVADCDNLAITMALKNTYKNQGEYYLDVYGVSVEVAQLAQWHPTDKNFCKDCDGWKKFILDDGIANCNVKKTEEVIPIKLF